MRALKKENINNILFLDIETAPAWLELMDAPEYIVKEWIQKFKYKDGAPLVDNTPAYFEHFERLWLRSAGLFPEFSRIVCISVGYIYKGEVRLKSYIDKDEAVLLDNFINDLGKFQTANKYAKLCAHYGKGFDYPFIAKRLLIHRRELPFILDTYGVKPWELENLLDTMDAWRGTLGSIAMSLGIPSPKDDIDGADVSSCYHSGQIKRIADYCEKDVLTLINVFKAIRGEKIITL